MNTYYRVKWADCDGSISISDPLPTWVAAHDYKCELIRAGHASQTASWIVDYAPRPITPQVKRDTFNDFAQAIIAQGMRKAQED